ncbi:MAG: radical SAM protein [Myxococcota bacterium]
MMWFRRSKPAAPTDVDDPEQAHRLMLRKRMARPQRHRLLQGYPMAPLMAPIDRPEPTLATDRLDPRRPLLVGVLPHPFCNPQVTGCGFCTFPHEKFARPAAERVVEAVIRELEVFHQAHPDLCARRQVDGLYFGGGTANLTPPDSFARLVEALRRTFTLRDAEVTLEGVPIYFLTRDGILLDHLQELGARHQRLSMGVQTFDTAQLERMGRTAFGKRAQLAKLVSQAHARGMTLSADLLFNLPHQSQAQMLDDVTIAAELGFDQICVYHLVLFEGLGTAWSKDPSLLAALPDQDRALDNWLAVREHLQTLGYVQSTLTNFERRDVHHSARRFIYEAASFQPETYDGVGFGPGGLSTWAGSLWGGVRSAPVALKTMNATSADAYVAQVDTYGTGRDRFFRYNAPADLQLLHITRQLPLLRVRGDTWRLFFGGTLHTAYPHAWKALEEAKLVTLEANGDVQLTPKGMFFADSVAGLLAEPRVRFLRETGVARVMDDLEHARHAMG